MEVLELDIAEKYRNFERDNTDKKHGLWKKVTLGVAAVGGSLIGLVAAPVGLAISAIEGGIALAAAFGAAGAAGGGFLGAAVGNIINFFGFSGGKKKAITGNAPGNDLGNSPGNHPGNAIEEVRETNRDFTQSMITPRSVQPAAQSNQAHEPSVVK